MGLISDIVSRGNDAINLNPPGRLVDIHLTVHGSDWLWAVFAVFLLLTLIHVVWFIFTPSAKYSLKKFLLTVPLFTNIIMAFAYFTYASNLGWTSTATEFYHVSTDRQLFVRQIFYVKYIGWFCAYPFVILAMEIATHSIELKYDTAALLYTKLFNLFSTYIAKLLAIEIFVLGLLIGGLIPSTYKWGYWVFAISGLLFTMGLIANSLIKCIRSSDFTEFGRFKKVGLLLVSLQLVIWILYPICWGVSEGGNKIQPDSEAVFYGILDLFTFGFIPTVLTYFNTNGLDDGFFQRLIHFHHGNEKLEEPPRASGETGETAVV